MQESNIVCLNMQWGAARGPKPPQGSKLSNTNILSVHIVSYLAIWVQRSREMGLDAMSSEWILLRLDCELADPVDTLDLGEGGGGGGGNHAHYNNNNNESYCVAQSSTSISYCVGRTE